jgi:3-oxoadipate enol-lactonase
MIERTSPAAIAAAQRDMAARPDVTGFLPTIWLPTLILAGAEDAISPPAEMQSIAEAIPGAQFVEIPDSGHMAPMENPDAVNEALHNFVEDSC